MGESHLFFCKEKTIRTHCKVTKWFELFRFGAPSGTRTLGPMIKSLSGRWKHLKNRLFYVFFVALQPFYRAFDFPIWGKLGKTDLFILRIKIFLLRKAEIRPKNAYRHLTSSYCRRGARPKAKRVPAGFHIPGPA